MKISDLDFHLVEVGRADSDRPVRSLVVRLATDTGAEGWGESSLGWRLGELVARRQSLLPVLAGRGIFDVQELLALDVLSSGPLRSAIEMAVWDLVGKAVGQPVANLWGGAYRPRIPLAVRLAGARADRLAHMARTLAGQGFHTQVVTACGRLEEDLRTIAAVREAAGPRVTLRLDGAEQYDAETARDLCAALEFDAPEFVLDPLQARELFPLASLGRQTSVPLAAWRAIHSASDVLLAVRCGAIALVVVDLEQVGGMVPARKCAAVAEAGGLRALVGSGPSLGIATAAMLQVAAATPAFACCNECAFLQLRDHVLAEPLEVADGMMAVPRGAGLGIEVDRAKLERYQVT